MNITYKDYRKQKQGTSAPLAIKSMHPLVAIDQFLKHVLPPYFQKSRYYGIHNHSTYEAIKDSIPKQLRRNTQTIRILFSIINYLSGLSPHRCEACNGVAFSSSPISVDHKWIFQLITIPNYRGPPQTKITNPIKT